MSLWQLWPQLLILLGFIVAILSILVGVGRRRASG
jgi:hypothetical protein